MLYTPAALELALRCPLTGALSSGGDDDKPEMAESTFSSGAGAVSAADMLTMMFGIERKVQSWLFWKIESLMSLDSSN